MKLNTVEHFLQMIATCQLLSTPSDSIQIPSGSCANFSTIWDYRNIPVISIVLVEWRGAGEIN